MDRDMSRSARTVDGVLLRYRGVMRQQAGKTVCFRAVSVIRNQLPLYGVAGSSPVPSALHKPVFIAQAFQPDRNPM